VELYDTGHLFQVEPGFISPVKTQASPSFGQLVRGRCLVVVGGPSRRVVLGALQRGRGASTRVLALFSDSSAFIASFATFSCVFLHESALLDCRPRLPRLSLSESDSLDVMSSSVMGESVPLWVIRASDSFLLS
jgi:hypothetical protein